MPKPDKKQRHKSKREAKRRELRKRESVSPLKAIAELPGETECWVSDHFESRGQLSAFVFKRAGGRSAVGCFLVDRGVVGLKDAWIRIGMGHAEFKQMIELSEGRGVSLRESTADEIRDCVAGGARWAHGHGMRLPKDWLKTASLIGGVGDWLHADVSEFAKEFAGHPEDLRQRLIGEPFSSFLDRDDIHFIFSDHAPYMNQKGGRYVSNTQSLSDPDEEEFDDEDEPADEFQEMAARFTPAALSLADQTINWLNARGEVPSPELPSAWASVMVAHVMAMAAMPNESAEAILEFTDELLDGMVKAVAPELRAEHARAIGQTFSHFKTDRAVLESALLQAKSAIEESSNDNHNDDVEAER